MEAHLIHLEQALERLLLHELFAKREKFAFGLKQIQYLGHVIFEKRVSVDKDKITTILNWPLPKSVKGIRLLRVSRIL